MVDGGARSGARRTTAVIMNGAARYLHDRHRALQFGGKTVSGGSAVAKAMADEENLETCVSAKRTHRFLR